MIDQYFLTNGWEWALSAAAEALLFLLFIHPAPSNLVPKPSRLWSGIYLGLLLAFSVVFKMFSPEFLLDATLKIAAWTLYLKATRGTSWTKGIYLSAVFFLIGDFSRLFVLSVVMQVWLNSYLLQFSPSFITNAHTVLLSVTELLLILILRPAVLRSIQLDLVSGIGLGIIFPVVPYIVVRYAQFGHLPAFVSGNVTNLIAIVMAFCTGLMLIFNEQSQSSLLRRIEAMNDQMLERERSQYLVKQEIIEDFNRKYHDFKHYLTGLLALESADEMKQYIRKIQNDMEPYHVAYETGNPVVNAILSEKMLLCKKKGIVLEPDIDARSIGFISSLDLCTIFGNVLDNAIEAVESLPEADRRIEIRVKTVRKMIGIHVRNPVSGTLIIDKGRFQTTKNERQHLGVGIENIQNAVKRYGGTVAFETDVGNDFVLNILLPLPERT